jgi:hypothetical protein
VNGDPFAPLNGPCQTLDRPFHPGHEKGVGQGGQTAFQKITTILGGADAAAEKDARRQGENPEFLAERIEVDGIELVLPLHPEVMVYGLHEFLLSPPLSLCEGTIYASHGIKKRPGRG